MAFWLPGNIKIFITLYKGSPFTNKLLQILNIVPNQVKNIEFPS